jgi:hypothetical protein
MAKKPKTINELELVNFYENNNISVRKLSLLYGINSARCAEILKRRKSRKYAVNSARHGHLIPWNKGKDKSDPRIAASIKKMSHSRLKTGMRSGYQTIFNDILNKRVRLHDHVWHENTGHWPDHKNDEQIHHIDGDKNNNNIDNLLLVGVNEHSRIHKEYELVFLKLLKLNILAFDKKKRGIDWKSFYEMVKKLKK